MEGTINPRNPSPLSLTIPHPILKRVPFLPFQVQKVNHQYLSFYFFLFLNKMVFFIDLSFYFIFHIFQCHLNTMIGSFKIDTLFDNSMNLIIISIHIYLVQTLIFQLSFLFNFLFILINLVIDTFDSIFIIQSLNYSYKYPNKLLY